MGALWISLSFFLFFFLHFPELITSKQNCLNSQWCRKYNPPRIDLPFGINEPKGERCGDRGFQLICTSNETVLELPFSGKFFVRDIYYYKQKIEIYDPDNCLPKRLLNLNLSGSPFKLDYTYDKYTFLNCSSSVNLTGMSSLYIPISCLSSSTNTIYAANIDALNIAPMNTSCVLIATVSVPIKSNWYFDYPFRVFYEVDDVLVLTWPWFPLPPSHTNPREESSPVRQKIIVILSFCIGLPVIILSVYFVCLKRCGDGGVASVGHISLAQSSIAVPPQATVRRQPINVRTGLDDSTIQSYPRVLVDDNKILPNPNNTSCPICLSEYRPKETLKSIPSCNHFFHANCIEKWLRVNATCPVCRKSPISSLPPPVTAT